MNIAKEASEVISTLESSRCYAQCPCCEEPILLKDAGLFYLDDFSPDAEQLYQQLLQDLKERGICKHDAKPFPRLQRSAPKQLTSASFWNGSLLRWRSFASIGTIADLYSTPLTILSSKV